ncbi:MAG: EF-P beta-lysylation protein EpmB [Myxococcales bacterium]|nr:EF-P beta-lysylation protein EpmB [Myxococcales bacterium]MCB9704817.1 EF-P beta-lysylation protein EpmB [Myxococcales bacterium]
MTAALTSISAPAAWQRELAAAFTDPRALLAHLGLGEGELAGALAAAADFPMRAPRPYVARIVPGDPADPLLRQILPIAAELAPAPGFVADPLVEQTGARPGLLHKYRSRALVILRGGCAINCRYCFRRHFPYGEHALGPAEIEEIARYVAARPEINEVILSGGDPLLAKDAALASLVDALAAAPQLRRLRIHTRLPITIPSRITAGLVDLLARAPWPTVIVFHVNHPRELDDAVDAACRRLRAAGVTLLNQSVLLRGVNDDARVLAALSERLFDAGILPYYLHLLDRVAGAAHFEVDEGRARALMAELLAALPGFLVPKLVREVAGEPSKVPLDLRLTP